METDLDLQHAKSRAQSFFDEMLKWEQWSAELGPHATETNDERLVRLKAIFENYLSKKALTRGQSRYDLLGFDTPSDFAEPILKVEESGPKSVWVYTARGPLDGTARYQLVKESGTWKIDFCEVDAVSDGDWERLLDL